MAHLRYRVALRLAVLTATAAALPLALPAAGQTAGAAGAAGAGAPAPPAAAAPATAADTPTPPTKVAVVSIRDAMTSTEEGKRQFDVLLKKFNDDQAALKTMDEDAAKMQADLNAAKDKLTPAERTQRGKAIQAKLAERQKKLDSDKNEFQTAQQAVVNNLAGKLLAVLGQVADSEGYDVVLDVSNPNTPVMWARPSLKNLTADLVTAYDAAYPQK